MHVVGHAFKNLKKIRVGLAKLISLTKGYFSSPKLRVFLSVFFQNITEVTTVSWRNRLAITERRYQQDVLGNVLSPINVHSRKLIQKVLHIPGHLLRSSHIVLDDSLVDLWGRICGSSETKIQISEHRSDFSCSWEMFPLLTLRNRKVKQTVSPFFTVSKLEPGWS